jgi:hypothetical protein
MYVAYYTASVAVVNSKFEGLAPDYLQKSTRLSLWRGRFQICRSFRKLSEFRLPNLSTFDQGSRSTERWQHHSRSFFPFKLRGKTDRETDKEVIRAVKQKLVPTAILIV